MCANLESLKCGIKVNNKLAKDFYDILKDCLNESFGKLLIRDLKDLAEHLWENDLELSFKDTDYVLTYMKHSVNALLNISIQSVETRYAPFYFIEVYDKTNDLGYAFSVTEKCGKLLTDTIIKDEKTLKIWQELQ